VTAIDSAPTIEQLAEALAGLGHNDRFIASRLNIHIDTIKRWRKTDRTKPRTKPGPQRRPLDPDEAAHLRVLAQGPPHMRGIRLGYCEPCAEWMPLFFGHLSEHRQRIVGQPRPFSPRCDQSRTWIGDPDDSR
jgi:hypothetical protein